MSNYIPEEVKKLIPEGKEVIYRGTSWRNEAHRCDYIYSSVTTSLNKRSIPSGGCGHYWEIIDGKSSTSDLPIEGQIAEAKKLIGKKIETPAGNTFNVENIGCHISGSPTKGLSPEVIWHAKNHKYCIYVVCNEGRRTLPYRNVEEIPIETKTISPGSALHNCDPITVSSDGGSNH